MQTVTAIFPPSDNNIGLKYYTISRVYEQNECTAAVKKMNFILNKNRTER